jgi:GPH family glycoside/pentoside/hexuronide:cation symporter
MAIAQPLGLLILQLSNFQEGQNVVQPPSALLGVRLVIGILPAILLCSGILMAVFYPLTRKQHHEIVEGLKKRRADRKRKREEKKSLPGAEEAA